MSLVVLLGTETLTRIWYGAITQDCPPRLQRRRYFVDSEREELQVLQSVGLSNASWEFRWDWAVLFTGFLCAFLLWRDMGQEGLVSIKIFRLEWQLLLLRRPSQIVR